MYLKLLRHLWTENITA